MKLLMITEENLSKKIGVGKKVFGQAKAFSALGFDTCLLYVSEEKLWLWQIGNEKKELDKISGNLDILLSFYGKCLTASENLKPDVVYIRAPFTEYFYLRFLRALKRRGIKIVVEYPTFPYDHEYKLKTILKRLALPADKFFRKKLRHYVSRAVTYTDYDEIFRIPAIKIENGIDLDDVPLRKVSGNKNVVLIGVANLSAWHGYDRVIEGMNIYYRNGHDREVYFEIIGEGPQLPILKELIDNYKLNDYVHFHAALTGTALDEMFDKAHIGIGSLGMHRINLKDGAPLKSREYCARGIPFIIAYKDNDFTDKLKYVLNIPPNDEPVDINEILTFADTAAGTEVADQMRNYAKKNISWENKLQPVIAALAAA